MASTAFVGPDWPTPASSTKTQGARSLSPLVDKDQPHSTGSWIEAGRRSPGSPRCWRARPPILAAGGDKALARQGGGHQPRLAHTVRRERASFTAAGPCRPPPAGSQLASGGPSVAAFAEWGEVVSPAVMVSGSKGEPQGLPPRYDGAPSPWSASRRSCPLRRPCRCRRPSTLVLLVLPSPAREASARRTLTRCGGARVRCQPPSRRAQTLRPGVAPAPCVRSAPNPDRLARVGLPLAHRAGRWPMSDHLAAKAGRWGQRIRPAHRPCRPERRSRPGLYGRSGKPGRSRSILCCAIPADWLDLYRSAAASAPACRGACSQPSAARVCNGRRASPVCVRGRQCGAEGPMQFEPGPSPLRGAGASGRCGTRRARTIPSTRFYAAARDLCSNGAGAGQTCPVPSFAYNHAQWYVAACWRVPAVRSVPRLTEARAPEPPCPRR